VERPCRSTTYDETTGQVKGYVERYNNVRLKSTIAYIAPRTCSPAAEPVNTTPLRAIYRRGQF